MLRDLRLSLLLAALALPGLLLACGDDDDDDDTGGDAATATSSTGSPSPTTGATEPEVRVVDNAFQPATLNVDVGTEVTWTFAGSLPHSVVGEFAGEDVESETITGSGTFTFTFEEPGTFEYICAIHGAEMAGTIEVE